MGNSRSKSSASTPSTSSQSSNFSTAATAATVVAAAAGAYVAYKASTNSTVTATQNPNYTSYNGPPAYGTSSTRISSGGQFGITRSQPSAALPTHIPAVPPTHIPAVPVAIEASRFVIFDANNYVINNDSACGDNCEFIPVINGIVSYRQRVDKFSMRICPQYNSTKGCHFDHCYRFHICQFWVKNDCKKSDCSYSHSLNGTRNVRILRPHMRRNFGEAQLLESLQKGSFVSKAKHGDNRDYICMAHIFRKCTFKDCTSHHISSQFMWEISIGDKWERFPQKQNFELEKSFCDPKNCSVVLSKLSSSNNGQGKQTLLNQALGDSSCTVDFEMLQLTSTRSFFRIRRLSTPSDILQSKSVATRWLWYWQESSDVWHAFSSGTLHSNFNGTENNYFIIPLSDHLEFSFWKGNMEVSVTINNTRYDLNLEHKTQLNLSTGNLRLIRRRPMFIENTEKWNSNNTYRSIWTNTNYDSVNFGRVDVSSSSPEYTFVCSMLKKTLPLISSIKVQRIENPHQWESYQLKKKQYLDKYNGSLNDVNEQYLFHGTNCSVVDKICADSFDWRLFGSNVGNVYGRGTYFSNLASLSDSYASVDDDGFQCMFIALVLVGLATIGNTGMTIPPKNPATKKRFDTTVNDNSSPSIFVKYDLDEYYPAYFLRYKT